jgi:hypothetical protein
LWSARCSETGTAGAGGGPGKPTGGNTGRAPRVDLTGTCSEDRAFELKLVNAHHVKILPGRNSDVLDAEWLAELLEHGLLRGSFVPPPAI